MFFSGSHEGRQAACSSKTNNSASNIVFEAMAEARQVAARIVSRLESSGRLDVGNWFGRGVAARRERCPRGVGSSMGTYNEQLTKFFFSEFGEAAAMSRRRHAAFAADPPAWSAC
jgi:hypothetical protein